MALFKKTSSGLKLTTKPSKTGPMVFPVGAGLTANQQVQAYKKVAPKSVMATGIQSVKPKTSAGVNYTPVPGGALSYTPIPGGKLDYSKNYNQDTGYTAPTDSATNDVTYNTDTIQPKVTPVAKTTTTAPTAAQTASAKLTTKYGGVTPGTAPQATAGDLVTGNTQFDYNLTPEQKAYQDAVQRQQDYADQQSSQDLNQNNIYQDTLAQFQGEIDAANQIYAQKLAEAKSQGQSRLGTTRAENFNAGAVNSSFGNAAQEKVQQYNAGIEGDVQAQKLQTISTIENQARELGNKYYEAKKAAKEAGLESYVASIKNAGAAKDAIASNIADGMITANVTVDELNPEQIDSIAKKAGVSPQQIKIAYANKQAELAAAVLKGQFNLSEGQARYDANGNLIASRAKTYKGSGGTGTGGTSSVSEAALNFAKQIQSGAATLQNVPSAMRAEVATALMQLPSQKVQELDQVINLIDELSSNKKLDNITGPIDQFTGGVFGQAAVAKNIYNQLQGVLALEGRSKLKGSGAISDFEFKVLKDAQSALGRNLPASAVRAELDKVKGILNKRRQTLISQGFVGDTSSDTSTEDTVITGQEEQVTLPDGTVLTLQPDGTYE